MDTINCVRTEGMRHNYRRDSIYAVRVCLQKGESLGNVGGNEAVCERGVDSGYFG